jgi:hypothetical protein
MPTKKPPDLFHCLKIPLRKILVQSSHTITDPNAISHLDTIQSAVLRVTQLVHDAYLFIKHYLLHLFQTSPSSLPIIDETFIRTTFKVLIIKHGRGVSDKNMHLFQTLQHFYLQYYQPCTQHQLVDGQYLAQINNYQITQMITAIENNIKRNYLKYIKRYVKAYTQSIQCESDHYTIFQDLINGTFNSNTIHHDWIRKVREWIIPFRTIIQNGRPNRDYIFHPEALEIKPQRFLPCLIKLNLGLEELGAKLFNWFPSTCLIPRHIALDTTSLVDLFVRENKKVYHNIMECHDLVWDAYFRTSMKIFNTKNYRFNYRIETDGWSATIFRIEHSYAETEDQRKHKRQQAKNSVSKMTVEQKTQQTQVKLKKSQDQQERIRQNASVHKSLSSDEKTQLKKAQKEFPYFNDLPKEKLSELKESQIMFIDPGMRSHLTMMSRVDGRPVYLSYTNRQRQFEMKLEKMKRREQTQKQKGVLNIQKLEQLAHQIHDLDGNLLIQLTTKTCSLVNFEAYLVNYSQFSRQLLENYQAKIFRQHRLSAYVNQRRSEANLLNRIEKLYGNNAKIIIGDWQRGEKLKHFPSTPGVGLKRLLSTRFEVYEIDEYRTSCLHHQTEERCSNLVIADQNGKNRKLHAVLTYQMENKRLGCINRDKNAVLNMEKIYNYYQEKGVRPTMYSRGGQTGATLSVKKIILKGANRDLLGSVSNGSMPFGVNDGVTGNETGSELNRV